MLIGGRIQASDIKTHLDERKLKADDLHQTAVWEDDYTLIHKGSFTTTWGPYQCAKPCERKM